MPVSLEDFLDWRNIIPGNQCDECGGAGGYFYANTATWRRAGVAGQAITYDVCDKCWGSGDKTRPWPSWRNS